MRVLILDDERVIVDALCMVLNQSGYSAKGVYSHDRAIAIAHAFEPDVLLTGFNNCCDENGCETGAEVLTFLPQCRVMIFSGSAAAAPVVEEFSQRGYPFDVFAKPVHPQDLLDRLKKYQEADRDAGIADDLSPAPEIPPEPRPVLPQVDRTWWDRLRSWLSRSES
jgi:DNA-binding NtrC family response regulator